jgi:GNAT superfamily N-acetyltransferase
VAGYAYAGAYRPRPAYRFTVENSIYLDPSFHRRGIGLALLEKLTGWTPELSPPPDSPLFRWRVLAGTMRFDAAS